MSEKVIRLASYNIRKARGLDHKRDPGRTLDVINRLGADIVVLQEADRRLGDRPTAIPHRMIEEETDFTLVSTARNDVSLGWHGNAVLVRPELRIKAVDRIDLPGLEPRGAVRVDFEQDAFSLFGVHLGLRRRDRRRQIRHLLEGVDDPSRVVVAGDFNEWSEKRGLEELGQRFRIHAPGRSFHARRPIAALDRVALGAAIELRDGGVEESRLARRASDHLPIWTDIRVSSALDH